MPSHHLILKPFDAADNSFPLAASHEIKSGEACGFTVTSNRFLRGMIRKTVGTLLMVGKGKMEIEEFKETVLNKKEFRIHYLAPPNGLFLSKIKYPSIT